MHAFDRGLVRKSDITHLRMSKKLNRALITLDRDFLYYEKINLKEHPGVIVISVGTATPPHVNKVSEKLLKAINEDFVKNALIKVTVNKIIKSKEGKMVTEKSL